ncbi:MAG: LysM peptidoglycan-binding domain-containing protein [Lachnospiraceae bacterium]|nr:LysM peptidoglycan-binding domain-containing protein [Lachnospiraceae bacterium]
MLLKCLYVTGEDTRPYGSFQYMLPFHYAMDVKRAKEEQVLHVNASVDQMSITMTAADEVNVKAQVGLHIVAFDQLKENIICSMDVQELNQEKIKNLPGMAIYVVKEGDSLWDIGKKYYVPVSRIKEVNNLTKDECKPLDKLLVVRV